MRPKSRTTFGHAKLKIANILNLFTLFFTDTGALPLISKHEYDTRLWYNTIVYSSSY